MRWIQKLRLRVRAVFRRQEVEREMEAELAEHLESEVQELIARGLSPADARKRARATMGHLDLIREECRDSRGTAGWEQFKQDLFFGIRLLLKHRTFSCIALATMALGIGSTTAVFSLIDGVLTRPLPFTEPDRLFHVQDVGMPGPFDMLRANSGLADYAAHIGVRAFTTPGRDWPDRLKGSEVSANFFEVLRARPVLGRTFVAGEDQPGRIDVAVLSHDLWMDRYGGRKDVIGQPLVLNEASYSIIGVMPAGFQFPAPEASFWIPIKFDPRSVGSYWGSGGLWAFARLRPGTNADAATAELRAWIPRIRAMFPWPMPEAWGVEARFTKLQDYLVAGARLRSLLLFGVVALVLLIAIVNVASLMIGQTAARRRELTLRASLGATPGRLARQLLTEALVLALVGGVLGTLLAFGQLALLKQLLPADTPRLNDVVIDGRVLAFTAATSLASGLLFGLLPAWRARSRRSLTATEESRSTLSPAGLRTHGGLVMAEAAFAAILLVGAGLLLRSLWTILQTDPGFQVESVITAELSVDRATAGSPEKTVSVYEQVRTRLMAFPGVTNAAAMNLLPLTPEFSFFTAAIEDHPRPPQEPQFALWCSSVTPEHLQTLGIPLLQGRGFTNADRRGAPPVVLVSKSTARRFWPDRSPLGRRLRPVWGGDWFTIVGVVDDVKNYSMSGPPDWVQGEVYVPIAQAISVPEVFSVIARLNGDSGSFEKQLPQLVKEACPDCAVSKIVRMETVVAAAVHTSRSTAWLVSGFALLALGLAAAGIYGVVSHGVIRRTRELGVRLALGASRSRVAWLVVGSSLAHTAGGTLIGLAVSWLLARWINTLLYGIAEHDPVSFLAAPVVLVVVAILATLVPMYRALRIDPAISLRET